MRNGSFNTRSLHVSAVVVLAALLFRAYIPVGFMPTSGAPFQLELCPGVRDIHPRTPSASPRFAASGGSPRLSVRQCARSRTGFRPHGLRSSRTNTLSRSLFRRTQAAGHPAAPVSPTSRTAFSRLDSFRRTKRAWKRCIPRRARRPVRISWGESHANCVRGPSTGPSLHFWLIARPKRSAFTCNSHYADRALRCRCR